MTILFFFSDPPDQGIRAAQYFGVPPIADVSFIAQMPHSQPSTVDPASS